MLGSVSGVGSKGGADRYYLVGPGGVATVGAPGCLDYVFGALGQVGVCGLVGVPIERSLPTILVSVAVRRTGFFRLRSDIGNPLGTLSIS